MPVVKFRGRVLPTALQINISGLSPFSSQELATGETMQLRVAVVESLVTVEVEVSQFSVGDDISIMHTRATHVARSVLDCFAFANGFGLIVFLDEIDDGDGVFKKIRLEQKELAAHFTAFKRADGSIDYDAMHRLVATDPDLSLAINDLIMAVAIPGHIAINCGRAIEAIRKIIVPVDPKRTEGWKELRRVLQLEQSYVEFITAASTNPRHGSERYLPSQIAHQEMMKRTWIIMNRFLEYKKRGDQQLPVADFPILA